MAYRLSSLSFAEKVMRRAICAALYVTVLLSTTPGWAQQPLADFVTRFYEDVLRRDPDPTEAGAWANFLRTSCNPAGFAALAGGFFDSSEFRVTRPLSLNGLVTELYRTFLGRDPEPAGLAAWADLIRQARLAVAGGFIHASEFQSLLPDRGDPTRVTAVVTGFYTSILGRAPEPAGLQAWVDYILRTGDLEGAASAFLASPEFESHFFTARDYVTVLYRAFLRRDPEEAGLDAWEAILRQTLLAVINTGFVPSAEFQGLVPEVCGTPTLTLTSLSSMAASPLEVVRMTGSGFEPAGKMVVRFSDTTGLSIDVIPVHVTSGTLSVAVPPVPDAASGAFGGRRTVNVEVVRDIGGVSVVSNVVTGFQIGPLPTTRAQAGVVTTGFLMAARNAVVQLQGMMAGTALATPDMNAAISRHIADLTALINGLQAVRLNPATQTFSLGSLNGIPMVVRAPDLGAMDRLVIGLLQAIGGSEPAGFASFVNADSSTDSVVAAEIPAGPCGQLEARNLAPTLGDLIAADEQGVASASQAYYKAYLNCVPTAGRITGEVLAASSGIALPALELAGAPAIALAAVRAELLVIQTELNALVVGAGTILKNLGDPDGADAIARGLESEVKALRDAFKGLTENPDTNGLTKEIVDNALAFRRLLAAQSPATHPATLPPVPPPLPTPGAAGITLTWQLQGVSFDDGGTVTGTFNFDTTRWVSTDWNITVAGGNTAIFPPLVYTPANSSFNGADSAHNGRNDLVAFVMVPLGLGRPAGVRNIILYFTGPLTDPSGTPAIGKFVAGNPSFIVDISTTISSNFFVNPSNECFDCTPFRVIVSGVAVRTQ